jgi:hypothetical protein
MESWQTQVEWNVYGVWWHAGKRVQHWIGTVTANSIDAARKAAIHKYPDQLRHAASVAINKR